jgi:hypothetical protein
LRLADVGEDEQRQAGGRSRDAHDRDRLLVLDRDARLRKLGVLAEQRRRQVPQPEAGPRGRQRAVHDQDVASEQPMRPRVREAHVEVPVDRDDALVQLLEEAAEAVAVGGQLLERVAEPAPHPVDAERERADLVAEPARQRRIELAAFDRCGGLADPLETSGDQGRREQPGDRGGKQRPERGAHDLVAKDGDRRAVGGRPRRVRDERLRAIGTAQRQRDECRPVGAPNGTVPCERVRQNDVSTGQCPPGDAVGDGRAQQPRVRPEDIQRKPTSRRNQRQRVGKGAACDGALDDEGCGHRLPHRNVL